MREKVLIAFLFFYLVGAFHDYLNREGVKSGLWSKILWRDGAMPISSLAKSLLWPVRKIYNNPSKIIYTQSNKTTAMQFAEILNNTYKYPLCNAQGCVQDITAKDNTVIATYKLPGSYSEITDTSALSQEEISKKMRPNVLRDICGEIQSNFPDNTMIWMANYYSSDHKFLASISIPLNECLEK